MQVTLPARETPAQAVQLSEAIYGGPDDVVTVRGEVSLLRRTLRAVVQTRPYRLAPPSC